MRPGGSKEALLAQAFHDSGGHSVLRIDVALVGLPEMVGDEFQQQRLWPRPGKGGAGCGERPGLQIGKVSARRVFPPMPSLTRWCNASMSWSVKSSASSSRRSIGGTLAMVSSSSTRWSTAVFEWDGMAMETSRSTVSTAERPGIYRILSDLRLEINNTR
jgi:hypothetical protein